MIHVVKVVLDASALLAFLFQETGADFVAARIADSLISTVNYSEVIARALERGMLEHTVQTDLALLPTTIGPFDTPLAFRAATLKTVTRRLGLSLADRACLALGIARNLPVVTGDRAWKDVELPVECVLFR
jgi:ribonuclease VapC